MDPQNFIEKVYIEQKNIITNGELVDIVKHTYGRMPEKDMSVSWGTASRINPKHVMLS